MSRLGQLHAAPAPLQDPSRGATELVSTGRSCGTQAMQERFVVPVRGLYRPHHRVGLHLFTKMREPCHRVGLHLFAKMRELRHLNLPLGLNICFSPSFSG